MGLNLLFHGIIFGWDNASGNIGATIGSKKRAEVTPCAAQWLKPDQANGAFGCS